MRLGFSVYVSPRFRTASSICDDAAAQARYQFSDLLTVLPWLVRYFIASSPERALHSAMPNCPSIPAQLIEHEALIAEAQVPELLRRTGWLKLFRLQSEPRRCCREPGARQAYGVLGEVLDAKATRLPNPIERRNSAGAIHWPTPGCRSRSGGFGQGLLRRFLCAKAGRFLVGDARSLERVERRVARCRVRWCGGRAGSRGGSGAVVDLVFGRLG